MKKICWLYLLIGIVSISRGYGQTIREEKGGTFSVSTFYRTVVDAGRSNWSGTGPRKLKTVIWFPEQKSTGPTSYPLLMLSHGANSTAEGTDWIGKPLAAAGYIVVAPQHIGDSTEEMPQGMRPLSDWNMWERPADISIVLDYILKDSLLGRHVQKEKIGAIGFSLGGYTVLATGGAQLDMDAFKKNSVIPDFVKETIEKYNKLIAVDTVLQQSLTRAEKNYRDPRIKGIFVLSPAIGDGFTRKGLKKVKVPVMVVVGEQDYTTPKETNAFVYAKGIKKAGLQVLPGEVGHVTNRANPQVAKNVQTVNELSIRFFDQLFK